MTAEIKTVIGQLSITGGTARNDAPNQVAVREPKSADTPGAGKGDLFVLTEVRGPVSKRDTVERQLAEAIRDAYYLARGSITASLRRALQAGGDQLYRHNQQVNQAEKIVAGVVAVVVRDRDAFVAQTGPVACFAVLNGYIRRYPDKSPWLDEGLSPKADKLPPALGMGAVAEPNLHHLRLNINDMLILADGRLAGQLPLDSVLRAVTPQNAKATVKNLSHTGRTREGSALVLAVGEADRSTLDVLKDKAPTQFNRLFDRHPRQPVAPSAKAIPVLEAVAEPLTIPLPTRIAPPPSKPALPPQSRAVDPAAVRPRPPARPAAPVKSPPPAIEDEEEVLPRRRAAATTAVTSPLRSGRAERHPQPALSAGKILRWLGAGLLVLAALLGSGLRNILSLVLPQTGESTRQAGAHVYRQPSSTLSWPTLRNIAIAIPLVVGVVVAIIYLQKGRMMEAEYTEFVATARNKFQQAQAVAATDTSTGLGLITEAQTALVEAEKIKANQPEITELRQQMTVKVDEMGKVQRLYYLPQLRQYTDPGTRLKGLMAQGVDLYVLDAGTDRVFHHRLDDQGETLLPDDPQSLVLAAGGQEVEQVTVNRLLDMTWMPAGGNRQTSDLLMLTGDGLLEYNANWGLTTLALAGSESLGQPAAVSSYFGNFYVLTAGAPPESTGRLLRYLPTANGYSTAAQDYFPADPKIDLTGAVDIAIDGAVYVLFKDGRLSKFQAGNPVDFNLTGLDKPFNNPIAVFTKPDEEAQYIYVADAGNQRVVQLEKNGQFVRQFKPRDGETVSFANLQDIYVDELGGRLYILDSNNLYVANIPTQTVR